MYSLADRLLLMLPGLLGLILALATAMPLGMFGITLTPNIAWIMTLALAALYPAAWAFWFAFLLGLLQDFLFGTPLGSQAVLALLLWLAVRWHPLRLATPLFRLVLARAVLMLVAWHALLWLLLGWVGGQAPPFGPLLITGVVNGVWFALLYFPLMGLLSLLPEERD